MHDTKRPPTLQRGPPATTNKDQLEKLKKVAVGSTTTPLTPQQNDLIEKRIDEIFLGRRTPDHPPYQFMIENAIKQLNEEGGSSMVTISKFIRENHENLPWHHEALVEHHLGMLCECGNLIEIHEKRYSVAQASPSSSLSFSGRRERRSPKENARGIKLHRKEITSWGRGRGRGRGGGWHRGKGGGRGRGQVTGRSLGRDLDDESSKEEVEVGVSQVEATEKHVIMLEEEADEKGLKENARRVKLHGKCKEFRGLGRGRGRGRIRGTGKARGRGRSLGRDLDDESPEEEEVEPCVGQVEDKVSADHMEATEKQHTFVEEEADGLGVKETARRIKLRQKCKEVEGLSQGRDGCRRLSRGAHKNRGRGRSLGWGSDKESVEEEEIEVCVGQVEDKVSLDHMGATEKQYVMVEDKSDEKVQSKERCQVQGSEDSLNVRGQAAQRAMISETERPEQEYRVNEGSSISQHEKELVRADNSSRGTEAIISNEEQEQNEIDLCSPRYGKGRGRSCTVDMQKEETGKKMEQMEAAKIGALRLENQLESEEQSQPKEDPIAILLENFVNDEVPKWSVDGIFQDLSTDATTVVQELSMDDIPLLPESSAIDAPVVPDLSANETPVVPDLSIDDIPLISESMIVDFIPKENLGQVEPPEGYILEPLFKEKM